MQYGQYGDHYVLRIDEGEEAVASIRQFLVAHDILAGYFVAWGAFSRLRLVYNRPTESGYQQDTRTLEKQLEVASLLGNIACSEGQPVVHAHLTVGDEEFRTYSGHMAEGIVRPMLEVFVTPFPGQLRRTWDDARRLAVLDLAAAGEAVAPCPMGS